MTLADAAVSLPSWLPQAFFVLVCTVLGWLLTRMFARYDKEQDALRDRTHDHANTLAAHAVRIDNLEKKE